MTRISTVHLTDPEFVASEWKPTYSSTSTERTTEPTQRYKHANDLDVHIANDFLKWTHDHEVISYPQTNFYTVIGKRIVDIVIASLVIVFILPWMILIIGVLILVDSPGPFFFIQKRSGQRGKPFACLKFRTMHHTPHKAGFQQTMRDDTRVTRFGRFLRRTNLDEMPQFINVLLGDMSLVGPRPHALQHDAMHWSSAAYRERYWVRPGITGLAQIKGSRGATIKGQWMEHRVRYDHFYIPRQTFLLDMKICLWTLKLMFKGDKHAW